MSDISGITSSSGLFPSLSVTAANTSLASVAASTQLGGLFSSLNLSPTQQTQIQQILQNAKTGGLTPAQVAKEINSVLTPTQQTQLQAELAKLGGRHHHHHGGGGAGQSSTLGSNTDAFGIPVPSSSTTNSGNIANVAALFSTQSQLQPEGNE